MGGEELFTISVSLDVYKRLEAQRQSFKEDHDAILRRLFHLPAVTRTGTPSDKHGLWHKGVLFPEGMKFRRQYKGNLIDGEIRDRRFWMNGKAYPTPARAAFEVTKHNVNAWRFWQYFNERTQKWEIIDELRPD